MATSSSFNEKRDKVLSEIFRVRKEVTDTLNKREEKYSESMFTNAVTYLAIMFAFCGYISAKDGECGWCIIVSAISLSLSLLFRLIDFLQNRSMFRRYIRISKKMWKHVYDTDDDNSLHALNSVTADLLSDEKDFVSSSVPIMLQMVTLISGVIFSVVALIIAAL